MYESRLLPVKAGLFCSKRKFHRAASNKILPIYGKINKILSLKEQQGTRMSTAQIALNGTEALMEAPRPPVRTAFTQVIKEKPAEPVGLQEPLSDLFFGDGFARCIHPQSHSFPDPNAPNKKIYYAQPLEPDPDEGWALGI